MGGFESQGLRSVHMYFQNEGYFLVGHLVGSTLLKTSIELVAVAVEATKNWVGTTSRTTLYLKDIVNLHNY